MGKTSGFKTWLIVGVALLDDIAVVAIVILVLRLFDVDIPLGVGIGAGAVVGGLVFVGHLAVVPSLRRRKITGSEGMIGLAGSVTEALRPGGTVKVNDEYWTAKSIDGAIDAGEPVEVVGIKGLTLEVKRKQ